MQIGGGAPIVVQTMITTDTTHVDDSVTAILRAAAAGAEIVRVTAPTMAAARALGEIRAKLRVLGNDVPLVADVHHNGWKIAIEVARHVDKVRINPGLFVFRKAGSGIEWTDEEIAAEREAIREQLEPVVTACREHGTAMRIGVNHGSLAERMLVAYGDTPRGMVESALEFIGLCQDMGFHDLVVSLKASQVPVMIAANRLFVQEADARGWNVPLHLGVTEAGDGETARVKSTAGIGTLLALGLGDTIRVSLAEDEVNELPVCYDILQSLGLRITKTEFIACPSCGRTKFDIVRVLREVKEATRHLPGLKIAVMGCIVNGPGEMADADYGYVGKGGGLIDLYRGHDVVRASVPQEEGVAALVDLLKCDGRWVDAETAAAT